MTDLGIEIKAVDEEDGKASRSKRERGRPAVMKALSKLPGSDLLMLMSSDINDETLEFFGERLVATLASLQHTKLSKIVLSWNDISSAGLTAFCRRLMEAKVVVEGLDFNHCRRVGEDVLPLLRDFIRACKCSEMDCRDTGLGAKAVAELKEMLTVNETAQFRAELETETRLHREHLFLKPLNDECSDLLAGELARNGFAESAMCYFSEISDRGLEAIAAALKKNAVLRELDISYCRAMTEKCGSVLLDLLKENKTLVHIDVRRTAITHEDEKLLAAALERNRVHYRAELIQDTLKTGERRYLSLSGQKHQFSDDSVASLPDSVFDAKTGVTGFAVGSSHLTDSGLERLCERFKGSCLRALSVHYCAHLSDKGGLQLLALAQALPSLCRVDLEKTGIGAEVAEKIDAQLRINRKAWQVPALRMLTECKDAFMLFSTDSLGDPCITAFCKQLPSLQHVQGLNLAYNDIGDEGAAALGAVLAESKTLLELNLDRNPISDTGLLALCGGLEKNASLRSLNIGSDSFGEEGFMALVKATTSHPALAYLSISTGKMPDRAQRALVTGLLYSAKSLATCYVQSEVADAAFRNELQQIMKPRAQRNCDAVLEAIAKRASPRLDVSYRGLVAEQIASVCEALARDTTVTELVLDAAGFYGWSNHLLQLLQRNTTLCAVLPLERLNAAWAARKRERIVQALARNQALAKRKDKENVA